MGAPAGPGWQELPDDLQAVIFAHLSSTDRCGSLFWAYLGYVAASQPLHGRDPALVCYASTSVQDNPIWQHAGRGSTPFLCRARAALIDRHCADLLRQPGPLWQALASRVTESRRALLCFAARRHTAIRQLHLLAGDHFKVCFGFPAIHVRPARFKSGRRVVLYFAAAVQLCFASWTSPRHRQTAPCSIHKHRCLNPSKTARRSCSPCCAAHSRRCGLTSAPGADPPVMN